jgi:uncharacterized membrane protein YkvI
VPRLFVTLHHTCAPLGSSDEGRLTMQPGNTQPEPFHIPMWLGFCVFFVIAVFFLWQEHRAHLLGALPYLVLVLCPIIHLLMHRGHHGASHDRHAGGGAPKGGTT